MGGTTDAAGKFVIQGIEPGNHWIRVSFLGYEQDSVVVEVRENEVVDIEIGMKPAALSIAGLQISAVAKFPS